MLTGKAETQGTRIDGPLGLTPQDAIVRLRGQAVILDSDLAALYGVTVKRLNEQVRRNIKRFPEDFVFQLTPAEAQHSRSQFATLKRGQTKQWLTPAPR
jgi:hypothetical protein